MFFLAFICFQNIAWSIITQYWLVYYWESPRFRKNGSRHWSCKVMYSWNRTRYSSFKIQLDIVLALTIIVNNSAMSLLMHAIPFANNMQEFQQMTSISALQWNSTLWTHQLRTSVFSPSETFLRSHGWCVVVKSN